jgi:hypothetical protein
LKPYTRQCIYFRISSSIRMGALERGNAST